MSNPKFSEETILSVAKTTLSNARNHLNALAEFGISGEFLNEFEANIQTAEALPAEVSNRIDLRNLTRGKADALDACYQWGRKLRARLQLAFGNNSSQVKSFPSKQFNAAQSSESKMMPVMEILINIATQYQTELAAFGQTPEMLAQGNQLLENLRQSDQTQELKKDVKKSATQDRYQKFQTIYDTVNRITRVGRLVFEDDPVNRTLFESKWPTAKTGASPGPVPPENPE
jgi:hypothetical protein